MVGLRSECARESDRIINLWSAADDPFAGPVLDQRGAAQGRSHGRRSVLRQDGGDVIGQHQPCFGGFTR